MMVEVPPVAAAVTPPLLLTVAEVGSEELQVSGTSLIVLPTLSTTVGVTVFEVLVEFVTVSSIECTAHVGKYVGTLLAVPMVAKMEVRPGTLAIA
jgi:hypothetical protein